MSDSNLETLEGWIAAKDGAEIYIKTWKSASKSPIATMVFVHGLGEHVNRYNDVFPKFQIENIEVHAFDQRGFGRTARKNKDLGITISWKTAISDITEVLIRTRREGIPQFLFGHSMGGGWSLYYACEGPERNNLAGIIISAPLITLAGPTKISEPVLKVGGAISKVLPNLHVPISMNANYLTRVPEEVQKYQNDPLISTTAPLRFLSEMFQVAKSVLKPKYNRNIKGPIYISHGTGDCITSYKASRQLYEMITATDKTLCEWPGLYHEMHNEAKRDQVINGWIRWILDHAKSAKNDYAKNSQSAQAIQNPVNIGLVSA